MSCEHHWHDEGIWEYCCECNAHECQAIQRVRELHRIVIEDGAPDYCLECRFWYPCDTIKALDGEQS